MLALIKENIIEMTRVCQVAWWSVMAPKYWQTDKSGH